MTTIHTPPVQATGPEPGAARLDHELELRVHTRPPQDLGGGRLVYEVAGGSVSGPRVRGAILAGSDWATVRSDGYLQLDVRFTVLTDDGATIGATATGLAELSPAVLRSRADGQPVGCDELYYRAALWFHTGDDRYSWIAQRLFLGVGSLDVTPLGLGPRLQVWRVE